MRLLSYSIEPDAPRVGLLDASSTGVIDVSARIGLDTVEDVLRADRLDDVRALATEPVDHALADVRLERTLTWPSKVFCIGVNYGGRSVEYADPSDAAYPSVFVRFPDSFTGSGRSVQRPPESDQLDYEGEIVAVIGKAGRRIPVEEARSHIAGLTLGNEGTIRDWVRHAKFNVTQGKNWEATGSIGPWLVTMDEFGDVDELHLTTTVNGELRQDDHPRTMKYAIDYQVHYLSTFTTLRPGDVIFTGTPTGAGARFDPPRWLVPGDVVEVSVPEIGTLRNDVVDEFPDGSGAHLTAPVPQ